MDNLNSQGFNKPTVEIFAGNGSLLKYPDGRSLGDEVHKFNYVFDEEGDDKCNIVFKFNDPTFVDHPSLRHDRIIYVRWGYPNTAGGMSARRLIAIRDTITNYDSGAIRHELICTDQVAYLKTMQHNVDEQQGLIEWMKGLAIAKLKGIKVRLRTSSKGYIWTNETQPTGGDINILNGLISVRQDNTFMVKPIVPAGMSVYRVLKEEIKLLKDGPYLLDGRDGTLDIRKRDFAGIVLRTFNVGNGKEEVVSFIPKSQVRKNEMEATEYGSLNGTDGTGTIGVEIDANSSTLENLKTQANFPDETNDLYNDLEAAFEKGMTPEDAVGYIDGIKTDYHITNRGPAMINAGDGGLNMAKDNLFFNAHLYDVSKYNHWSVPEQTELAERKLENLIREMHQDKYQAELTTLGIPQLIPNRSIYMNGKIASMHKGKYYIKSVTHKIDRSGYLTSCSLIKTPFAINVIKQKTTSKIEHFNTKEQEKKESFNIPWMPISNTFDGQYDLDEN